MSEPQTEAGKHFLLLLSQGLPRREGDAAEAIAAIEAEARATVESQVAVLREALTELRMLARGHMTAKHTVADEAKAAFLMQAIARASLVLRGTKTAAHDYDQRIIADWLKGPEAAMLFDLDTLDRWQEAVQALGTDIVAYFDRDHTKAEHADMLRGIASRASRIAASLWAAGHTFQDGKWEPPTRYMRDLAALRSQPQEEGKS